MLKFLIILGVWIAPGILLFLYLLWVSKLRRAKSAQLELPLTHKPVSRTPNRHLRNGC